MTSHDGADPTPYDRLMASAMAGADRFGHRQHVHLTWLAVRQYDLDRAVEVVSAGIRRTARYAGVPQKYNATVSRAWVELVAHHAGRAAYAEFDTFAEQNPDLLDKRLLTRFYTPATLASRPARNGWVAPDRAPFPWTRG